MIYMFLITFIVCCMFLITFILCYMFLITFILCCHFSALGRDNTAEVLKHYPPAHVISSVCCVCWRGLSLVGDCQ